MKRSVLILITMMSLLSVSNWLFGAGTYALAATLTYVSNEQYSLSIVGEGRSQTVLDGGSSVQVMSIDTGDNNALSLGCADFKGNERIIDGIVDSGAMESGSIYPADPNCNDPDNPIGSASATTGSGGGSSGGGCFVITLIGLDTDSDAYHAAERAAQLQKSAEVQNAIAEAKMRLQPKVARQRAKINRVTAIQNDQTGGTDKPELLIFVSSSMPLDHTIGFVRDAHQIRDKSKTQFILNGFPASGLTPFIASLRKNQYALDLSIDPFLFETYEVNTVPAVIANRTVKIDHPRNLRYALSRIQAASDQHLTPLIQDLNW